MRAKRGKLPPAWLLGGERVDYHAVIGEAATEFNLRVRTDPQLMDSGHWVVWLDGKAGCVSVEACTPATGSLGPSNDDSPAVQVEMRAAELVGQGFGPFAGDERDDPAGFTPGPSHLVGWLAREIAGAGSVVGDNDDATAWTWDTSRPLAEQLAETAADDAAAALEDDAEVALVDAVDDAFGAADALVDENNEPEGVL